MKVSVSPILQSKVVSPSAIALSVESPISNSVTSKTTFPEAPSEVPLFICFKANSPGVLTATIYGTYSKLYSAVAPIPTETMSPNFKTPFARSSCAELMSSYFLITLLFLFY